MLRKVRATKPLIFQNISFSDKRRRLGLFKASTTSALRHASRCFFRCVCLRFMQPLVLECHGLHLVRERCDHDKWVSEEWCQGVRISSRSQTCVVSWSWVVADCVRDTSCDDRGVSRSDVLEFFQLFCGFTDVGVVAACSCSSCTQKRVTTMLIRLYTGR